MATKYLLPCQCGESHLIDVGQAGQTIRCHCGQSLEVPTMRDIRRLKQVEVADERKAVAADWNRVQGSLFAIGLTVTILSLIVAVFLWINRQQLDTTKPEIIDTPAFNAEVDKFPPDKIWQAWQEVENHGLGPYYPPDYILARQESAILLRWIIALLIMAAGGAATTVASFFFRQKA